MFFFHPGSLREVESRSQIYASDMFSTVFKGNPTSAEAGLRYRKLVIGKGSSEDEMEMLVEFLGRPPNASAFYAELGLP